MSSRPGNGRWCHGGLVGSIVVIGGSAGAHGALQRVCEGLPPDFPSPILVVLHVPPHLPSRLASILTRAGPLPAIEARDGQELLAGRIHVAPPDHHLLVGAEGTTSLGRDAPERGFRPSIDVLFRSAATAFGAASVGVILSGALTDGVAGAEAIRGEGGVVIAQDPEEARFGRLPRAAVDAGAADLVVPSAAIAAALCRLAAS
jgi:two-component system chemotaxis response regulator CheB